MLIALCNRNSSYMIPFENLWRSTSFLRYSQQQFSSPKFKKQNNPSATSVGIQNVTRTINIKKRRNHDVSVHGLTIRNHDQEERSPPDPRKEDGMFNYSHNIVKTDHLFQDFQDAIKESDGARMEYLWKFMMQGIYSGLRQGR